MTIETPPGETADSREADTEGVGKLEEPGRAAVDLGAGALAAVASSARFAGAMAAFGANQFVNLLQPRKMAAAFDSVAGAASQQLDAPIRRAFELTDALQEKVMDTVVSVPALKPRGRRAPPAATVRLTNTTHGPLWPPSEAVDKNGDFIVIGGVILQEVAPGKVAPVPNKGVIVSKDTPPPLKDGKVDYANYAGAAYTIVRELDLSPDSPDWDMELYATSAGPFVGDFDGGRPRIPAAGDSAYNLNPLPPWIAGLRPQAASSPDYRVPVRPLNQVHVWHLDGIPDHVPIGVPVNADGSESATGGFRAHRKPITLRKFMSAKAELGITLTHYDEVRGVYTHARFDFTFEELLPHAVYSISALRTVTFLPPPDPRWRAPDPLAIPNAVVTNGRGNARVSFEIPNPFPAKDDDPNGNRIIGVTVAFHSDYQTWGAAVTMIGAGVEEQVALENPGAGRLDMTDFVTKAPRG